MFCPECGKEISNNAVKCAYCNATVEPLVTDNINTGYGIQNTPTGYNNTGYNNYNNTGYNVQQQTGGYDDTNVYIPPVDRASFLLKVISFFFPIIGIILYFVKKNITPLAAKSYLRVAIVSFVLTFIAQMINMFASMS